MTLTENVSFIAVLQRDNRVQIPVNIRWRYKLEAGELLKARICLYGESFPSHWDFVAKLQQGGRIQVPWLIAELLKLKPRMVLSVTLKGEKD